MPLPLIRYPLDPTGINPDNAVYGEVHTLSNRQIRAVAPTYGPFFTESLMVFDNLTNQLLVRGTDFQCVELLQEATVKFGKEIAQVVLILNQTVSDTVRISYQTLGGLYQNETSGIANLYETFLLDDRAVDWVNVLNKPYQYPPTLHQHLLQDVYGFEPVVIALERIRNAIVLSDVPAFEALIEWVKARMRDVVTEEEIDNITPVNKFITFDKLLYALDKLNFNAITLTPTVANVTNGSNLIIKLSSTALPDNTTLYWTIEHITTSDDDFNSFNGIINVSGNRGEFTLSIKNAESNESAEQFKVNIRKNSIDGPIVATTSFITIGAGIGFMEYMTTCCIYKPTIAINPTSMFMVEGHPFRMQRI